MDKTLIVLAAGIGSRFGGIKQIAKIWPRGHTLLDFTITDAINAWFTHIIHIIREDIQQDYASLVANKYINLLYTTFVHQEIPKYRTKPRWVAQALCLSIPFLTSPCAVVNADDYYGAQAMKQMAILLESCTSDVFGMIGYILGNTLSGNGGVNRWICEVTETGYLKGIVETKGIVAQGSELVDKQGAIIDRNAVASMNFWAFHQDTLKHLPSYVTAFQKQNQDDSEAELPLPPFVDYLIHEKDCKCRMIPAADERVGITYKEDIILAEKYFSDSGRL